MGKILHIYMESDVRVRFPLPAPSLELGISVTARTGDFDSLRVGFNSLIPYHFNLIIRYDNQNCIFCISVTNQMAKCCF